MMWLTFKMCTFPGESLTAMSMIKDKMYHYSYYNITEQVLTLQTYETLTINNDDEIMHGGFQPLHCVFCCLAIHHKANRIVT